MKKIFYTITAAILTFPTIIFAVDANTGNSTPGSVGPITIGNPFKGGSDLTAIVNTFLQKIVMPIAATVVVIMIIYSGFKYLTAQGKPEAIKEANRGLLWVLVGTFVLLGAAGISAAIQSTLQPLITP